MFVFFFFFLKKGIPKKIFWNTPVSHVYFYTRGILFDTCNLYTRPSGRVYKYTRPDGSVYKYTRPIGRMYKLHAAICIYAPSGHVAWDTRCQMAACLQ